MKIDIEFLEEELFPVEKIKIANNEVFSLAEELASKAEPNLVFSEKDKRWINFYLPVRIRKDREDLYPAKDFVLIPFALIYQNFRVEAYHLVFPDFSIKIIRGRKKTEPLYATIIEETINFLPQIKKDPSVLYKHVPYIYREGKVKRKYVTKPELTKEEAKSILKIYKKRPRKEVYPVSLRDYLQVAGYCLRAIFPNEAKLSDRELYEKHSDFRRAGMLELKEDDPKAFKEWYESDVWQGSHPFEIVASMRGLGIMLWPPSPSEKHYKILVGNELYYRSYLKAVEALIEKGVSLEAPQLEDALQYLTGEVYLPVNQGFYSLVCHGTEPFAKYVEWEPLKLPKLKS